MARSDYTDTERAGARKVLREALFTYMDTVEDDDHKDAPFESFEDAVDEVMAAIERAIALTVGAARPSRIVEKLREGAL